MRFFIIKIFGLIFFGLFSISTIAQKQREDIRQQRINLQVLNLIDEHQVSLNFRNSRDLDRFEILFENNEILIFNDIMPDNQLNSKITPNEYIRKIDSYYEPNTLEVVIRPYEISPIQKTKDNYGLITVYAKKVISIQTKNKVIYSDTFDIDITVKFNKELEYYKISSIIARKEYGKYCNLVILRKDGLTKTSSYAGDTLIINGEAKPVNPDGNFLLRNITDSTEIVIESMFVSLIPKYTITSSYDKKLEPAGNNDPNSKVIVFRRPLFYTEFEFGINPFQTSPITFEGTNYSPELINNTTQNAGINIGFVIVPKIYLFIKSGVHFKRLGFMMSVNNYTYSQNAIDPDNSLYWRTNSISNIEEAVTLQYISFPLAIQKNFMLGKPKNFISIEFGGIWSISTSSSYKSAGKGFYSGFYDSLYQITLAENGVYDFGYFDISGEGSLTPVENIFSLYGSGGFGRKLNRRMALSLNFSYVKGLNDIFEENIKGLSDDFNTVNSLTNLSTSYTINDMTINFRINYNF
ncbi:MAG: hypothetical protein COA49_03350 [Bacteroidetes bacterium]|nr:MAG: hypothetical protein COA49_03350 [Bacteroidota bacterium]